MEEAVYISTGDFEIDEYYHYGLAATFYTHFTSPIRRYADIIVHRQLLSALHKPIPGNPVFSGNELSEISNHLNKKHRTSKEAQRDSVLLFQSIYFKDKNEIQDAVIYNVKSNGVLVFIPKYGLKGTIYFKDVNGNINFPQNVLSISPSLYQSDCYINDYSVDFDNIRILLHTNKGIITINSFDHLTIKIVVQETRAHNTTIKLELVHFGKDPSIASINDQSITPKITKRDIQIAVKQEEEEKKVSKYLHLILSNIIIFILYFIIIHIYLNSHFNHVCHKRSSKIIQFMHKQNQLIVFII